VERIFSKLEIFCKELTGYMNLHDPHGRIARWTAELNQFNFKKESIDSSDKQLHPIV